MIICNVIIAAALLVKKLRTNIPLMFVVSIFVNIGMWFERFVIIVTSLTATSCPRAWGTSTRPWVDITHLRGRSASSSRSSCVISGKPLFALPTYVPIMFEVTVIFSAFAAVFGMFAMNGLPRFHHPVFTSERFIRASDDRFFISIEATDAKFDVARTSELLKGLGASHVEIVEP
jgi:hypothetical protein